MSDLSELLGLHKTVTIGGVTYKQPPLEADDWAEIEERIISRRPDPVGVADSLAANAPREIAEKIYMRAYEDQTRRQEVTADELDAYRFSLDGAMFLWWLQIRRAHPEVTEADGRDLLKQFGNEQLEELIKVIRKGNPEATAEEVRREARRHTEDATQLLVARAAGLPAAGNSQAPGTPGTQTPASDHSPGGHGSPSSESVTAGQTAKSGE